MAASHTKRSRRFPATLLAACTPLLIYTAPGIGLGLGSADIQTTLGQPLLAEIPILDADSQLTSDDIRVRQILGNRAGELGFDLAAESPPYQLSLIKRQQGLYLQIRSEQQMREPYVSILVEMEWPTGKLYRDYNLLLDLDTPAPSPALTTGADASTATNSSAVRARSPQPSTYASPAPTPGSSAYIQPAATAQRQAEEWRVGPGDTLSQIAQQIRPDGQIKLAAIIDALYRINPQAFVNGDINQLQPGASLTLPGAAEFADMPRREARNRQGQPAARPAPPVPVTTSAGITEPTAAMQALPVSSARYQVMPGDTLSQIAQHLRLDPDFPLHRIVAALHAGNPQAFHNNDINRLIVGAELVIPGAADAPALPATAPTDRPAIAPATDLTTEPPTDTASAAPQPRLHLSTAPTNTPEASAAHRPEEMSNTLAAVAEEVDKVNRDNEQIKSRIARIEQSEHIAMLEQLLELQEQKIRTLQQQLDARAGTNPDSAAMALLQQVVATGTRPGAAAATPSTAKSAPESAATPTPLPLPLSWPALLAACLLGVALILTFMRRTQLAQWLRSKNLLPNPSATAGVTPARQPASPAPAARVRGSIATTPAETSPPDLPELIFEYPRTVAPAVTTGTPTGTPALSIHPALPIHPAPSAHPAPLHPTPRPPAQPDPVQNRGMTGADSLFDDEPLNFGDLFADFDADTLPASAKTLQLDSRADTSDVPVPQTPAADFPDAPEHPNDRHRDQNASPDAELEAALDNWINGSPDATAADTVNQTDTSELSANASAAIKDAISEARVYAAYGRYDEAEAMLSGQLRHSPQHPELLEALADIRRQRPAGGA